jgi:predicted small integral membrane protein
MDGLDRSDRDILRGDRADPAGHDDLADRGAERERRGFLPIPTTPGDRLFIGLLVSAYVHLAWIGLTTASVWIAFAISLIWMAVVMRWG